MKFVNYNLGRVKLHFGSGRIRYIFIVTVLYFGYFIVYSYELELFTFSMYVSSLESWILNLTACYQLFLNHIYFYYYFNKFI
jgi:hypothetical protein